MGDNFEIFVGKCFIWRVGDLEIFLYIKKRRWEYFWVIYFLNKVFVNENFRVVFYNFLMLVFYLIFNKCLMFMN